MWSTVWSGAASGKKKCKTKGNFFTFDANGDCQYSYNGGIINTLNTTTKDKKNGFSMTYTSQENCAADATKKYQVVLDAVCDPKEGAKPLHTKIGNCKEMIRVTSPSACSVFDYGAHLGKYIAML